jgi:hypothetical protein
MLRRCRRLAGSADGNSSHLRVGRRGFPGSPVDCGGFHYLNRLGESEGDDDALGNALAGLAGIAGRGERPGVMKTYLDVPICPRGDLEYTEKLTALLRACGTVQWKSVKP